jgi:hypothetical protein
MPTPRKRFRTKFTAEQNNKHNDATVIQPV